MAGNAGYRVLKTLGRSALKEKAATLPEKGTISQMVNSLKNKGGVPKSQLELALLDLVPSKKLNPSLDEAAIKAQNDKAKITRDQFTQRLYRPEFASMPMARDLPPQLGPEEYFNQKLSELRADLDNAKRYVVDHEGDTLVDWSNIRDFTDIDVSSLPPRSNMLGQDLIARSDSYVRQVAEAIGNEYHIDPDLVYNDMVADLGPGDAMNPFSAMNLQGIKARAWATLREGDSDLYSKKLGEYLLSNPGASAAQIKQFIDYGPPVADLTSAYQRQLIAKEEATRAWLASQLQDPERLLSSPAVQSRLKDATKLGAGDRPQFLHEGTQTSRNLVQQARSLHDTLRNSTTGDVENLSPDYRAYWLLSDALMTGDPVMGDAVSDAIAQMTHDDSTFKRLRPGIKKQLGYQPLVPIGHWRGHTVPMDNAFLVDELQSDLSKLFLEDRFDRSIADKVRASPWAELLVNANTEQVHGGLAKAAIHRALMEGHDTVGLPTGLLVAANRGSDVGSFSPIYDKLVKDELFSGLDKLYGVKPTRPRFGFRFLEFPPDVKEDILKQGGLPHFKRGGRVKKRR